MSEINMVKFHKIHPTVETDENVVAVLADGERECFRHFEYRPFGKTMVTLWIVRKIGFDCLFWLFIRMFSCPTGRSRLERVVERPVLLLALGPPTRRDRYSSSLRGQVRLLKITGRDSRSWRRTKTNKLFAWTREERNETSKLNVTRTSGHLRRSIVLLQ